MRHAQLRQVHEIIRMRAIAAVPAPIQGGEPIEVVDNSPTGG
jgi:hypothetical protein